MLWEPVVFLHFFHTFSLSSKSSSCNTYSNSVICLFPFKTILLLLISFNVADTSSPRMSKSVFVSFGFLILSSILLAVFKISLSWTVVSLFLFLFFVDTPLIDGILLVDGELLIHGTLLADGRLLVDGALLVDGTLLVDGAL